MKILAIYLNQVGPINNQKFDFYDDWRDQIYSRVLFSGANGSGKSLVLRAIAELWQATSEWLENYATSSNTDLSNNWLQQWGGIAMILTDLPNISTPVGLVFGERAWFKKRETEHPEVQWMGEIISDQKSSLLLPQQEWLNHWSEARNQLILNFEMVNTPNMIYLDAEGCRWVTPKHRVGKILSEAAIPRWLVKYQPTEDWQGQLEASLINLKIVKPHKLDQIICDVNQFLYDKEINPDIRVGRRIQVKLKDKPGQSHTLDALSAGERQILIKLYLVSCWLKPGGVVMIDEPDHYLHPSLVSSFIAQLESLVEEQKGQLLISSHLPKIWSRYETRDKRIKLGGTL